MKLNVIPMPQSVEAREGEFVLSEAELDGISCVLLPEHTRLGDEGYELEVSPAGIVLRAATEAGLNLGAQTLSQLYPVGPGPWRIPCLRIVDWPRFKWRGV